ncbi:MAG: hypothetical protein JW795_11820 [Chitinivibrionales bacterium]|nr:hypothetical protein [Chitinivibrionales bacterium]
MTESFIFRKVIIFAVIAAFYCLASADTIPGIKVCLQSGYPEWCWAASTQSLCGYYDKNFTKDIEQVASVFTSDPMTFPSQAQLPTKLPEIVESNGSPVKMKTVYKPGKLTWDVVKRETEAKRPFIFIIQWNTTYYHCNVYCGYSPTDTTNLCFMDPGSKTKKWRRWSQISTDKGVDGKGTWMATLMVTSTSMTGLSEFDQTPRSAPLSIICTPHRFNAGNVAVSFKSAMSQSVLKVFNAQGSCLYQELLKNPEPNVSYEIPYSFATGNYFVTCGHNQGTGVSTMAKGSFTIIR